MFPVRLSSQYGFCPFPVIIENAVFCEFHANNVKAQLFNIGNMIYQPTLVRKVNLTDR